MIRMMMMMMMMLSVEVVALSVSLLLHFPPPCIILGEFEFLFFPVLNFSQLSV